ncbi:homoserine dehydrogenase [Parvularcula marina]|uniref:Homoserine dehydrogenase n=1 Tax=Parvularcula marina TaxID=2292771 RepID=A0A371RFC7_9PROT|nr:homoserine dehydrogenase [Parvularcula marina]RFB04154.1 homoserine dehydrogenase [Parvularcula marina]
MTLRIGIAGLGTVGGGLLSLLTEDGRARMIGSDIAVTGVSARTKNKARAVPIDAYDWYDDPVALAEAPGTDVFVELMGGAEGPAREAVTAALKAGKSVATANKALIAAHGEELARLAEENGGALKFEAAVAGGTPIVRALRDNLAPCRVEAVSGILNGTCNFVLDQMANHGVAYDDAVVQAQEAGFAEADPSLDVDGIDAAQKLAILAMLAFDGTVNPELITEQNNIFAVHGISNITLDDIRFARRFGFVIKLVGEAKRAGDDITMAVSPTFVATGHAFSKMEGAGNAVAVIADPLGELLFTGPGAGAGATASAVASDIVSLARKDGGPVFTAPVDRLRPLPVREGGEELRLYALRLRAEEGELDEEAVTAALAEAGCFTSRCELVGDDLMITTSPIDEKTLSSARTLLFTRGLARTENTFPILTL